MTNQKNYLCGICKTIPDQISHHKSHLQTTKHKDKRELFELKLSKLNVNELIKNYKTTNIQDIVNEIETIIYTPVIKNKKLNNIKKNENLLNMLEQTNQISNKEALKEKIHEIHNFLRNNGAGYGMNALKVFNLIYGLKKIEESQFIDKVGLKKPDCQFSYLLQLANEDQGERLAELLFGSVLDSINDSDLKELLFYEIPRNIRGSVLVFLIKEINKITLIEKTCNVLLSGKIYEYFIGRDESAISELGAYFTDRHIVDYILNKLSPCINDDGTISSMIDMFGGSGGFTTGYINYFNEKYPKFHLIYAFHCCAHIEDIQDLFTTIFHILNDNGIFIMEVGYFYDVFKNNCFDTIYHEHIDYHTTKAIQIFALKNGLTLFNVKNNDIQGGSIQFFFSKNKDIIIKDSVYKSIQLENQIKLHDYTNLSNWKINIIKCGIDINLILNGLNSYGKKIIGYGASAKSTTFLYQYKLTNKNIDYIIDDNIYKQNYYSPGLHIPVKLSHILNIDKIDYIIILSWNFTEEILKKLKPYRELGIRIIIPFPEIKII